jgi:uncharacterized membrane protein YkoI
MIRLTLAALLLVGASTVAMADSDANKVALKPGWLTSTQVTQNLQSQGYPVRKIKLDDGNYKVKATGPDQRKTKLEVSPSTGTVLSTKVDDDKDD